MYWGKDEEYHNSAVSNCMSYNRFKSLNCFFHSHGNASDTDNQDRLFKIRPVIDYLIRLFKSTYTPTQNLTIDEGMLAFKGRLSFKCYLPNKPIKYGIKLYILAESDTGYVSNFKIYSGAGNTTSEMVYDLMKDYRNKNYHLYMDNFYNSVNLSEKPLKDNIYTCGTLRIVRGAPKYFQASLKQLKKGDVTFCRKGDVFVIVWKDKKIVSMVTTNNNASTEFVTKKVKSKKKGNTVYEKQIVRKPRAIIDYNKNMKGVDFFDQMIRYYSFARRSSRWSKKITFYFLQMAIHNAYALYKQYTTDKKPMDLLAFHTIAFKALMNFKLDQWPISGHEVDLNDPYVKGSVNPHLDLALDNYNSCEDDLVPHSDIVISRSKIIVSDPLIRQDKTKLHVLDLLPNKRRLQCKKSRQTRYECKTCNIPLCIDNCYSYYHTFKDYTSKMKALQTNQ